MTFSDEDDQAKKIRELVTSLNLPVKINKKTEQVVNDFITKNGGYEKFLEQAANSTYTNTTLNPAPKSAPPKPPTLPPQSSNSGIVQAKNASSQQLSAKNTTSNTTPAIPPIPPNKSTSPIPPPPPPSTIPPPPSSISPQPPALTISSSIPPPPPPPPPIFNIDTSPQSINTEIKIVKINLPSAPTNLLDSIKGFEGFKNKPHVTQSSQSSEPVLPSEPSILDSLKNELLKRAQFLSKLTLFNKFCTVILL